LNLYFVIHRAHDEGIGRRVLTACRESLPQPRPLPFPVATEPATGDTSCAARLRELTARMRQLEIAAEKYMPAAERYRTGQLDPESARRLAPELSRILQPIGTKYELECRARVCRVYVVSREAGDKTWAWMESLREDKALPSLTEGWDYEKSEYWNDPVTDERYHKDELFLTLTEPDTLIGAAVVDELVQSFKNGTSLFECTGHYRDEGTWLVTISLSSEAEWSFDFSGKLSASSAGACLAERLRAAAAAIPVHPPVRPMFQRPLMLRSPPAN
jgi:hypothetical protein